MEVKSINSNTTLTISLVITLLGAAVSFGIVYATVTRSAQDIAELRNDVKELTVSVNQLIGRNNNISFER